jgi:hypothetical protein
MYRFDHLVDISPAISHIMDQLPEAKIDDSRTTDFSPVELIPAGTVIATSVGYPNNVSVDFGVYDLRKRNAISADANWAEMHKNESETAYHGICWLEYLSGDARESVLALPAGGGEGKMSDYCL